jgi:tRNA modification GTPase
MSLVIAGRPNAGKSSLLNALAGKEAAIVTEIPGTTRDVLREHIHLDGLPLHIIDTAGLRETSDVVEAMGVDRAWQAIKAADRILLVVDASKGFTHEDQFIQQSLPESVPVTRIYNKCDLSGTVAGTADDGGIHVSAKTGAGMDGLREILKQQAGYQGPMEGEFLARSRHLHALDQAEKHIQSAVMQLKSSQAGELAAEECRMAQQQLS